MDQHAVNCIIDTVRTNPGQVTIAAIVPCPPGCADALFRLVAQNGQRLVAQLLNMGADCRVHRVQPGKDRIGQPNVQFRLLPLPVCVGRTVRLGRQDRLALGLAVYLA